VYTAKHWPDDMIFRVFYPFSSGGLPTSENTIASILKSANYSSLIVGKWFAPSARLTARHLGHVDALPTRRGFDSFFGIPYSHDEGCPPSCSGWQSITVPLPLYDDDRIIEQPPPLPTLTQRLIERAEKFVAARAADGRFEFLKLTVEGAPFFLYVAFPQPHAPLYAAPPFLNSSRRGAYGDAVADVDDSVGRVLRALSSHGLSNRTLSIFTVLKCSKFPKVDLLVRQRPVGGAWTRRRQRGPI
jgi:arylsulfatase A